MRDTAALRKLRNSFSDAVKSSSPFFMEATKELAQYMLAEVKQRTPVGKGTFEVVGYYKRGPKKGEPKLKRITIGGVLRRGWQMGAITSAGGKYSVQVKNVVEYASYVEYGHRQHVGQYVPQLGKRLKVQFVEGQHMMGNSAEYVQSISKEILETKLKEFWGDVMK